MKLKTIFYCEHAKITMDNKVDAIGIVSELLVSKLPFIVEHSALIFVLDYEKEKFRKVATIQIEIRDAKGVKIIPTLELHGSLNADVPHTFCLYLREVLFPSEGVYTFNIIVDGELLGTLELPVELIEDNMYDETGLDKPNVH